MLHDILWQSTAVNVFLVFSVFWRICHRMWVFLKLHGVGELVSRHSTFKAIFVCSMNVQYNTIVVYFGFRGSNIIPMIVSHVYAFKVLWVRSISFGKSLQFVIMKHCYCFFRYRHLLGTFSHELWRMYLPGESVTVFFYIWIMEIHIRLVIPTDSLEWAGIVPCRRAGGESMWGLSGLLHVAGSHEVCSDILCVSVHDSHDITYDDVGDTCDICDTEKFLEHDF